MKQKKIDDVIADAIWHFPKKWPKGKKAGYIAIGRPRPDEDPKGDWICPIQIEGYTSRIMNIHGLGSLDALLNAINLLQQFFYMNTVINLEPTKKKKPTSACTLSACSTPKSEA